MIILIATYSSDVSPNALVFDSVVEAQDFWSAFGSSIAAHVSIKRLYEFDAAFTDICILKDGEWHNVV